ncbi:forkhead domain-containing protein [Purpureocillium lilacinum]|nr:forkhead domain-containing protein [Purpureocillium lilacinum]OAQ79437.1 forkhead domain-containing protein [Purpureocillium lilacinum]
MERFDADVLSPEEFIMATPSSDMAPKVESPSACLQDLPGVHPSTSSMSPATCVENRDEQGKLDEPYAKLIYKAFMSREDHAMSLQDMYQWFRDHTNKAVTEKGGWQNSIRHNLSMNAAFSKRRKDDGTLNAVSEDPKRANEWVLEPWAVQNGVQSTTRYRKGNSRRRPGGRLSNQQYPRLPTQHSAKRAVSGRKGGCAARESRMRDRAAYGQAATPMGRYYGGLEHPQGLPTPPRSTMPDLYHPESYAMPQFEPMTHVQHFDGIAPPAGPVAEHQFGLLLGPANAGIDSTGHGMVVVGTNGQDGMSGDPMNQMSAYRPAPPPPLQGHHGAYPYGARGLQMAAAYHGERQHHQEQQQQHQQQPPPPPPPPHQGPGDLCCASTASRLFETLPGGICDWADGGL